MGFAILCDRFCASEFRIAFIAVSSSHSCDRGYAVVLFWNRFWIEVIGRGGRELAGTTKPKLGLPK